MHSQLRGYLNRQNIRIRNLSFIDGNLAKKRHTESTIEPIQNMATHDSHRTLPIKD
jgi:hypothetical protein